MVLKRKRSAELFTSPMSISSSLSSRASHSPSPHYSHGMHPSDGLMDFEFTFNSPSTSWSRLVRQDAGIDNASGRTRKRFRDDRPDERAIYQNTLNKLFTAQKTHPNASPIPSHPPPSRPTAIASAPKPQKSTLHSFWSIPQQKPAPEVVPMSLDIDMDEPRTAAKCEDCDRPLDASEGETDMVDVDSETSDAWACRKCGRRVCGLCAVCWDERTCLGCAFRR